jgi:serine/threonine protein kinase
MIDNNNNNNGSTNNINNLGNNIINQDSIKKDNINQDNTNLNNLELKNNFMFKTNLTFLSSGSYGVILKSEINGEIYKITQFSDNNEINVNNFVEMIYLNFFKNKYTFLYNTNTNTNNDSNSNDSFLPIQNYNTFICYLDDFINLHKIDKNTFLEIKRILYVQDQDIIIVNKMKYYPTNLSSYIYKKKITCENFLTLLENLILGLHLFHSSNLSHGDLKSQNIVLNLIETKIIDFGGIKSIENPKYECTCTSTYRSPEDYFYEFRNRNEKNVFSYKNNSIKSDVWSLGLIMYEMVYGCNPILIKYNEIKNKNKNEFVDESFVEKKISDYYKTQSSLDILENDKKKFDSKSNQEQLFWFRISDIIQRVLKINPEERMRLDEIYSELFLKKLPNFEIYSNKFNYKINSKIYENKFLKFRNFYYKFIYKILSDSDEIFLYPMLINLFDRYLVTIFNSSEEITVLKNSSITNINNPNNPNNPNDFMDYYMNTNNIIYYDLENYLENNVYQFDHIGLITFTFYTISKILILKKFENVDLELYKFNVIFSKKFINTVFPNIFLCVLSNLINIFNKLNWDITRPKLYLYNNTDKNKISNLIKIINNFDIENMIEHIE